MFHTHSLHRQAESILRGVAGDLGEGFTFRRWNPVCAIGRLASETGFVPVAEATSSRAGAESVRRVYGLTEAEVREVMEINDAGGGRRLERLLETLRSFCPVCTRLGSQERRVKAVLKEE